jgi:hypothetical protein
MGPGDLRRTSPNQTPNAHGMLPGRQSQCANVLRREGKNPERLLRPRSDGSV